MRWRSVAVILLVVLLAFKLGIRCCGAETEPTVAGFFFDVDGSPLEKRVMVTVLNKKDEKIMVKTFSAIYKMPYPAEAVKIIFQRVGGLDTTSAPLKGGQSHLLSPIVPQ